MHILKIGLSYLHNLLMHTNLHIPRDKELRQNDCNENGKAPLRQMAGETHH